MILLFFSIFHAYFAITFAKKSTDQKFVCESDGGTFSGKFETKSIKIGQPVLLILHGNRSKSSFFRNWLLNIFYTQI